MVQLRHYCSDCESKFVIQYNMEECEDNPQFCPFCSTYILEEEVEQDEDY
jgi:hypothetical protein